MSRLLHDYEAKERDEAAVLGGAPVDKDLSAFGPRDAAVDGFADFSARVSRAPSQCVRYTFAPHASPLWAGRQGRPGPSDVPACERCGGPRRFEFQTMPQAITYLGVDSADMDAPDWASLAVYTCTASCAPLAPWPSHGGLDDPAGDEGGAAARAAVGLRCVLAGLNARADLNGRFCYVLYWHAPSSRWAIECEGAGAGGAGERLRVRSSNLRVARPASACGVERDGGYAEEFVWVQEH